MTLIYSECICSYIVCCTLDIDWSTLKSLKILHDSLIKSKYTVILFLLKRIKLKWKYEKEFVFYNSTHRIEMNHGGKSEKKNLKSNLHNFAIFITNG